MPYIGKSPPVVSSSLEDADGDTKIQVEESADEDIIRFDVAGAEDLRISANSINVLSGTTLNIDSGATITNSGTATGFGGSGTYDLNGEKLELDADADTSLIASTDDTIDIEIAGAAEMIKFAHGIYTFKGLDTGAAHDPQMILYRDSSSPADGDIIGSLIYSADNDAGTQRTFGHINGRIEDASDGTEDGSIRFSTMRAGTLTESMVLRETGALFISDSANTNMTQGITMDQDGSDDHIFALKSSDVAHGVTDIAETDTYFSIQKLSATEGGILAKAYSEGDMAMKFDVISTIDLSGDTATSNGHFHFNCFMKSGSGLAGHTTGSNLFVVENNTATQLVLKGNGELHLTNSTIAGLDTEDDAMLISQLELAGHKDKEISPAGIIETQWDNFIEKNDAKLKEIGVFSSENDFIVVQPWIKLANGAIWQQRAMFETLKQVADEMLPGFSEKLNERLQSQSLPALPV